MERESMEEGLIRKSMTKNDTKNNRKDDIMGSSVTPLLLFSTVLSGLVALSNGCAVSSYFFLLVCFIFYFIGELLSSQVVEY